MSSSIKVTGEVTGFNGHKSVKGEGSPWSSLWWENTLLSISCWWTPPLHRIVSWAGIGQWPWKSLYQQGFNALSSLIRDDYQKSKASRRQPTHIKKRPLTNTSWVRLMATLSWHPIQGSYYRMGGRTRPINKTRATSHPSKNQGEYISEGTYNVSVTLTRTPNLEVPLIAFLHQRMFMKKGHQPLTS